MTSGTKFIKPLIPMSYSQTLKWFRYFCTIPWRHSQSLPISAPHNYTVHSLKSTTLSWAAQLAQQGHVTEEQRHLQGHHRRGSMRLYSRDDTAGQLALQATLLLQVRKGYRFVTPLHRGSQTPLVEPAVTLEGYRKEYPEFHWSFFNFNQAQKDPFVPQTVYCWGSQCCLKCGRLGWGAVSASLGLSPNLSPIWLCLSPWLGCCVRLAEHVSQFVSHLALSFSLAGVLCLRWGAVSASLVLSPNLYRIWLCLSPWLGCCVRLAGLVSPFVSSGFVFHWGAVSASLGLSPNLSPSVLSPFVSHLALSFTLAGVLRPPRWACLRSCLPICFPRGFVFYVGWGVVSASLGLSPNLSPNLSPTWFCLSPWLGCCVRLAGLVS